MRGREQEAREAHQRNLKSLHKSCGTPKALEKYPRVEHCPPARSRLHRTEGNCRELWDWTVLSRTLLSVRGPSALRPVPTSTAPVSRGFSTQDFSPASPVWVRQAEGNRGLPGVGGDVQVTLGMNVVGAVPGPRAALILLGRLRRPALHSPPLCCPLDPPRLASVTRCRWHRSSSKTLRLWQWPQLILATVWSATRWARCWCRAVRCGARRRNGR